MKSWFNKAILAVLTLFLIGFLSVSVQASTHAHLRHVKHHRGARHRAGHHHGHKAPKRHRARHHHGV